MSNLLRKMSRRIRLALHRHDPIECWCELTDTDAPLKLPVQGPGAPCPTCYVRPGEEHELSCSAVSPELFCRYLGIGGEPR